jgi:hypothetical protein
MRRAERKALEFERFKANKCIQNCRMFALDQVTTIMYVDATYTPPEYLKTCEIKCVSSLMKRSHLPVYYFKSEGDKSSKFTNLHNFFEYMFVIKLAGI